MVLGSYIHFTQEQKAQAASVDLEDFLRERGETLLSSGKDKRLASDHSVTIRGNAWYDHAEEKGGCAISFVQKHYRLSYAEAVTMLLNSNGCTKHAPVTKDKVAQIQREADIVVFVESLEKEHRYDARLSFSTKLTDYFASGKCIFAIGDKAIAPIQYLEEYDCAITCSDYNDVEGQLRKLIDNPDKITEYGRKAFETGRLNHEESKVKETFVSTLCKAAAQNK